MAILIETDRPIMTARNEQEYRILPVETTLKGTCCHHWLIDRANGPESHAVCKYCHEERNFSNLLPQYEEPRIGGNPAGQGSRPRPFSAYVFGSRQRQALPGGKELANRSN